MPKNTKSPIKKAIIKKVKALATVKKTTVVIKKAIIVKKKN